MHKDRTIETNRLNLLTTLADRGGSSIIKRPHFDSPQSVIAFLPIGIFSALFRPLPGDINTLIGFGASLEGLLMLGLFLRACIRTSLRELKDPFIVFLLLLIFSWALVYAFLSYNMGTIMRWRLPVFPVFLGLLLYLGRHKKGSIPTA